MLKILISAGEESGDLYASHLVSHLKGIFPEVELYGLGGDLMRKQGVEILHDTVNYAVIGFWEVVKNYSHYQRIMMDTVQWVTDNRPDVVVLIDSPGFNLRLADRISHLGIPIVYYISPQIWAWGRSRLKYIERFIDRMLVILPFELDVYKGRNLDVEFVGHPLLDLIRVYKTRDELCGQKGLDPKLPLITLLPGSRKQEIHNHLKIMLESAVIIRQKMPQAQFILVQANDKYSGMIDKMIQECPIPIIKIMEDKYDWRHHSDLSLIASGTATLESAILGTPMIIVYSVAWFTYLFARLMIKIPYIGLVNVVAGKPIVPELIQHEFTALNVANKAVELLNNPDKIATIRKELQVVREKLGDKGASLRAAQSIMKMIKVSPDN